MEGESGQDRHDTELKELWVEYKAAFTGREALLDRDKRAFANASISAENE